MSCFSRDKGGFVTPPLQQSGSNSCPEIIVDQCLTRHMRRFDRSEYQEGPRDILPSDAVTNQLAIEVCAKDFTGSTADVASGPNRPLDPDGAPEAVIAPDDDGLTPSQRSTPDPGPCCTETIKGSRLARFLRCFSSPPDSEPGSPYRRRDTSLKARELAYKSSDSVCKVSKKHDAVSSDPAASSSDGVAAFRMDPLSEQCMAGSTKRWLDFDHSAREHSQIIGDAEDDVADMIYAQQCLGFFHSYKINRNVKIRRADASAIVPGLTQGSAAAVSSAYGPFEGTTLKKVHEPSTHVAVQAVAETKLREVQTVPDFTQIDNLKEVLKKLPVHRTVRRKTNKKVDIVHFTQLYSPPPDFSDETTAAAASVRANTGERYHITFQKPEPNFDPDDYNDSNFTYTIYGDIDEDDEMSDANKDSAPPKLKVRERRREYLI